MTFYTVAYIRGGRDDDSGPEMADAAMEVLTVAMSRPGAPRIEWVPVEAGAHCFATHGTTFPRSSIEKILELGIAFKAPTASAKAKHSEPIGLILRRELGTYASINELHSYPGVKSALRPDINIALVRDNSEGLFAMHSVYPSPDLTVDTRFTSRQASERVARIGFELARRRRKKLAVCAFPVGINGDQLFIKSCEHVAADYPDVEFWVRKVDAFAGTAVVDASIYDVIVAPNEWGSIMTDLFAATCGSVGLAARANLGERTAYFEPIHGTAPGKAGKGTVNPVSQIMAAKLMFEWLGRTYEDTSATQLANDLERAVSAVLATGETLTADLGGHTPTATMVQEINAQLRAG
jgi:isocitrate dehydrogenase (NAD+)